MPRSTKLLLSILLLSLASSASVASEVMSCVEQQYIKPVRKALDLPNPAEPGNHQYQRLTYGSKGLFSFSKRDIETPTVSLPAFLADYSRNQQYKRDAYHKFNSDDLALDARVWLPKGDGPFPLILLVHGNSDPGFDYLGDLFASRGYVVAQIDQTYLNGLWGENGARGWILLEHLKLWRQWNSQSDSPFYQQVDINKIALVGMSRGGEAVAHAASLNQLSHIPDSKEPTDFGFAIKAVAALAPMDGQYLHADGANEINNVDYLVLQGGHDADVYQYLGSRQWHRTQFDDGKSHLKQAIYIYKANHINFNQSMSGANHWGQRGNFDEALLTPQQQELMTKVFVSAFLEASLFSRHEYRAILQQPLANEYGLPEDIYISRYQTSDFMPLATFEKDNSGISVGEQNPLTIVAEKLRSGTDTTNHLLEVELNKDVATKIQIQLSKTELDAYLSAGQFKLLFSLARADAGESEQCTAYNLLQDAKVELEANSAIVFSAGLGSAGSLSPLLLSDFSELESDQFRYPLTEAVLQSFTVPLQLKANEKQRMLQQESLALNLVFKSSQNLTIMLDDIGLLIPGQKQESKPATSNAAFKETP